MAGPDRFCLFDVDDIVHIGLVEHLGPHAGAEARDHPWPGFGAERRRADCIDRNDLDNGLFWSVSETLKEFGEKELGGQIGFTTALHTWGQTLNPHVHIHCIVPGIGLSKEGGHIRKSGQKYLFDAEELSARFRDRFCRKIRRLYRTVVMKFQLVPIL